MNTHAQNIQEWRDSHPGARLTAEDLLEIIGLADSNFSGADLSGADLSGADLSGANFRNVDFRDANLLGANLLGADFHHANFHHADLRGADLRYSDLRGADFTQAIGVLSIPVGLPSGPLTLWRGPNGWGLKVGCLEGTPGSLRSLIAQDEGWPEARGEEVARRRPFLEAALVLCEVYIADAEKKEDG